MVATVNLHILDDVTQFGVAAGIAIYLVYWITTRLNKQLSELTDKIEKLNSSIERLTAIIEYGGERRHDKDVKRSS